MEGFERGALQRSTDRRRNRLGACVYESAVLIL